MRRRRKTSRGLESMVGTLVPHLMVAAKIVVASSSSSWDYDEVQQQSNGRELGFLSKHFENNNNIFFRQAGDDNQTTTTTNPQEEIISPIEVELADGDSISLPIENSTEASDDQSASNSSSSDDEPTASVEVGPSKSCRVSFNATPSGCSRRIQESSGLPDCDCYSFCGGILAGCHSFGENVPDFVCPEQAVMVGCQDNFIFETGAVSSVVGGIDEPCPPGYICSKYEQQSCDLIRKIPIWLGLGDIHAGLYCPGRLNRTEIGYENCDAGWYCPDSTTRIPCPEGYYCPHKTAVPDIACRNCPEGATTLARESYVYTIAVTLVALMIVVLLSEAFRKYNETKYNQLQDLQQRNLDGVSDVGYKRKHLKKMKALRPKFKSVERRLRQQYGYNLDERVVLVTETEDGKVTFESAILFDVLDTEDADIIPYSKLNKVLKLSHAQLRDFIQRMNAAAGESQDTQEVERHIFITQFLPAYSAVVNLDPNPEDAAIIFDETAKQGTTDTGEIPHRLFFTSPLAEFLTEEQINSMLKDFQRTKEYQEGDEDAKISEQKQLEDEHGIVKKVPLEYRQSMFGIPERGYSISRSDFIARYPPLLATATKSAKRVNSLVFSSQLALKKGIDLAFEKLSVSVHVKDRPVRIINSVSGRLCAGTMTALMGGPRSGKRSLLTALSGRSFYGSVSGTIIVNGHKSTTLENHSSFVGFVPKTDALYEELTVREHFIFSGKLRLREGTALDEIEDLAEATMASLNLSSVMHKPVGHLQQGGLSLLQRRCLSLGLEVMTKPRILFLEAPILNLDPDSALFIAKVLKSLAENQGITICSSLHNPRKDLLDQFDSLMLLGGVGGKLVYSGPVRKVAKYFNKLNYYLHDGESMTDWLLDIASGRLKAPLRKKKRNKRKAVGPAPGQLEKQLSVKKVMFEIEGRVVPGGAEKETVSSLITKPFDSGPEQAKAACEMLCDHLNDHIASLSKKKRVDYDPPQPYNLPRDRKKAHFIDQLGYQLQRLLILAERNWFWGFLDTTIVVVAVVLVTLIEGVAKPTVEADMRSLKYEGLAEPSSVDELLLEFPSLFAFAITGIRDDIEAYATKVGIVFALIICITGTRKVTINLPQFIRGASSGHSSGAFFLAINIWSVSENSVQAILASMFAFGFRSSLALWYNYVVHFLLLAWISGSWGLLFPQIIPKKYVVGVAGFLVIFSGLLFCGAILPIDFEVIYKSTVAAIASAILSPIRFFVEAMAVAEARSLPGSSGFTELGMKVQGNALQVVSFQILSYGLKDFNYVTLKSRRGWYWSLLPSLFIGLLIRWIALGFVYGSNRSRQGKKPLQYILKRQPRERLWFFAYMVVLLGLTGAFLFFLLR